jgi:PAS domain S-box-containing protein
MPRPLKVLLAEDNPDDAELVLAELRRAGFEPDWRRVETEVAFLEHLNDGLDLVLSDFQMPDFNGLRALDLLKQRGLEVPFILISGTIGEETAVTAMKKGATDYLLKDRLTRLGTAVTNALADSQARRDRHQKAEELRVAERALRDNEKFSKHLLNSLAAERTLMRTLIDNIPDVIYAKDTRGRFLLANEALAKLMGAERPIHLLGKTERDFLPNAVAKEILAVDQHVFAGEPAINREEVIPAKDGGQRIMLTTKLPLRDSAGTTIGLVGIGRDITDLKRADENVKRLAAIVEHSADAIIGNTLSGIITTWNPAAEKMFGYSAQEIVGQPLQVLVPTERGDEESAIVAGFARGETVRHIESVRVRKNGERFDVSATVSPIIDSDGRIVGASQIVRDTTARKEGEKALLASEVRFKALFDQAAVGVARVDVKTARFDQVNKRFCEITGRTQQELEQLTYADITHPLDVDRDLEAMAHMNGNAPRENIREKRFIRKDGSEIWVSLTVSAMWAAGEAPDYIISIAQDITERKRLEDQIRQSQKMEAIGTLAGGIAHDFNNILGIIGGYTELAQLQLMDRSDLTVCGYLDSVKVAAGRATDLVRQILTFSRQQELERRPIKLLPIVSETLRLLRSTIPSTIEFDISLAPDTPTVLADTTQIHQILMNLGTNAWHAMKDRGGKFKVRVERFVADSRQTAADSRLRQGVYAHVSVGDTGCGMDKETLLRIFEPFFTTKLPGEGTGLGLAVVHGIMDSHDGTIRATSRPGEGTVFDLFFPAYDGAADEAVAKDRPVPRGHGEAILYVDDEELLVQLGRQTLETLGYAVEVSTQPLAALELVRKDPHRFAMVFTDQTMPGITGLMLASKLRQLSPQLPVILMTGNKLLLSSQELQAACVRQLLPKPATLRALGDAAHAALSANPLNLTRTESF